jgi:transporter family protein
LLVVNFFSKNFTHLKAAGTKNWLFLLAEGLCAALLGHYAYLFALKYGKASSVVPITAAYPVVTLLLGVFLLGEYLSPGKIIGGLLVVLGVFLIKQF